jgi:hypothetical protein
MAIIIENPHMYNFVADTFNTSPEEISSVLLWRAKYLEKKREYNRKYQEQIQQDETSLEACRMKSREWFQNNKARAAARQKSRYEHDEEYRKRIAEYKKKYTDKKKQLINN